MTNQVHDQLKELGFSRYEIACYLALVSQHPANGSQISRLAGVARSKVYDVLRSMAERGLVGEVGDGYYVPLPPEELIKRLKLQFESNLSLLREQLRRSAKQADHEHLWNIRGYDNIMIQARSIIAGAKKEIYIRPFPEEGKLLEADLRRALVRGVAIRYISMGPPPVEFEVQIVHPDSDRVKQHLGGRAFDLVVDQQEAITGLLDSVADDETACFWTKNSWFITTSRDSLLHDFYHYFFHKLYELGQPLSPAEVEICRIIKQP